MKINLSEIPEEGRSYVCNRQTTEFNAVLTDLIGANEYHIEFFIKPLNSKDFELLGRVRTQTIELCSTCGIDFSFPIDTAFKEYLVPKQDQPRGSKYSRVNHVSDAGEGPSFLEYESSILDMGEYIHEVIGLSVPFNPRPPENDAGDCSLCLKVLGGKPFSYEEQMPSDEKQSPFQVLRDLKLN